MCSCGGKKKVVGSSLKKGDTKSCGCLKREIDKIKQKNILTPIAKGNKNRRLDFGEACFNRLYSQYSNSAQKRKYSFNISKEEFKEITQKKCYLCRASPSNNMLNKKENGNYIYNGVDRVNNKIGYEIENCRSCCGVCNYIKKDMNLFQFLDLVERISNKFNDKNIQVRQLETNSISPKIRTNMYRLFNSYKSSAKKRNIEFKLNKNQLYSLTNEDCYLCGQKPSCECNYTYKGIENSYIYNGIDRKNPNIGYLYDNCRPCCKNCNYSKRDMDLKEFLEFIEKIKIHSDKIKEEYYGLY